MNRRVSPSGSRSHRAILTEVSYPQPTLSPQAEKVIISGFIAGLLAMLGFALFVAGAPVEIALAPFALGAALAAVIGRAMRYVIRHGWYNPPGSDGSSGPGGSGGPREPSPHLPSGDTLDPQEWDRFVSQFWEHVERGRERELISA